MNFWWRIIIELLYRSNLTCILTLFAKLQHYWSLTIRLFSVISRTLFEESYPSTEMQSLYSAAPANWVNGCWGCRIEQLYLCRGGGPLPMTVLDMALNNLMLKLHSWSFRERGVPLHYHYSQVHSDLEW